MVSLARKGCVLEMLRSQFFSVLVVKKHMLCHCTAQGRSVLLHCRVNVYNLSGSKMSHHKPQLLEKAYFFFYFTIYGYRHKLK